MRKRNLSLAISLILAVLLVGCTNESGELFATYKEPEKAAPTPRDPKIDLTESGKANPSTNVAPQVDILFVVDNSASMIQEIDDATKDIYRFIDVFTETNQVDFHIGVTTVWDSVRYTSSSKQGEVDQFVKDPATGALLNFRQEGEKTIQIQGKNEKVPNYVVDEAGLPLRNFWSRGELLPIRKFNEASNRYVRSEDDIRFISKDSGSKEEIAEALKNLLSVDVIDYEYEKTAEGKQCRPKSTEEWEKHYCTPEENASVVPGTGRGPEVEEIFSPIQSALTEERLLNGPNKGFFRRSAFKVIVILSDADDSSMNISSEQLKFFLENSTDREEGHKVAVYAIAPTKESSSSCKFDYGLYDQDSGRYNLPTKLPEFIRLFGDAGTTYNICDPFGEKLAEMGQEVLERTLAQTEIRLDRYPQVTEETIRSELLNGEGLVAGSDRLFPELDCNPELLEDVFSQLEAPLEEGETEEERLADVTQYVEDNATPLPFDDMVWGPDWLRVCYGKQRVPVYDSATGLGFTWDRDRNSIKIRGAELLQPIPGGTFTVHAKELDLRKDVNSL